MKEAELNVDFLLTVRARIEWDWPDGQGRDVALSAIDGLLRERTQGEHLPPDEK